MVTGVKSSQSCCTSLSVYLIANSYRTLVSVPCWGQPATFKCHLEQRRALLLTCTTSMRFQRPAHCLLHRARTSRAPCVMPPFGLHLWQSKQLALGAPSLVVTALALEEKEGTQPSILTVSLSSTWWFALGLFLCGSVGDKWSKRYRQRWWCYRFAKKDHLWFETSSKE